MKNAAHGTPRRARRFAVASGLTLLIATAALLGWQHERLLAWLRGYEIVWLPPDVRPVSINNHGDVVFNRRRVDGGASTETFSGPAYWDRRRRIVVWLDYFDDDDVEVKHARRINDAGVVLVRATARMQGRWEAGDFLWERGSTTLVGDAAGPHFMGSAINDYNQVPGYTTAPDSWGDSSRADAALWTESDGLIDLGKLLYGMPGRATGINNRGWVVGYATKADGTDRAFLWRSEVGVNIFEVPPGFEAGQGLGVNERGEILMVWRRGGAPNGHAPANSRPVERGRRSRAARDASRLPIGRRPGLQ